jgi:hypothetical protein
MISAWKSATGEILQGRRMYIHNSGDLEQEEVSERAIQW